MIINLYNVSPVSVIIFFLDVFNAHLNLTTMDDNFYDWKSLVLNEWMDQLVLFDQDHQVCKLIYLR